MAPWLRNLRWLQWREFILLLVVAGICTSVWVFAQVVDEVLEGELHQLEQRVMLSLRAPEDPTRPIGPWWVSVAAQDVTSLGGIAVLTVMIVLVLGFLLLERMYHAALLVLISTGGGLGLSTLLKSSFARERPDVVPHLTEVMTMSFPSGHSMLSSVVYLTLGALLARTVSRRRVKIYFIHAAFFLSFVIGVSRIYLGVHYPTDVLAGWSAGTAWALLCWLVAYWLQRRGAVELSTAEAGKVGANGGNDEIRRTKDEG